MMRSKLIVGALVLSAAVAAHAQDAGNTVIGPAQLRNFSLEPKQRIVTAPETPPAQTPAPAPATLPRGASPAAPVSAPAAAPTLSAETARRRSTETARPAPIRAAPQPAPGLAAPAQAPAASVAPPAAESAPQPVPPANIPPALPASAGTSAWLYAAPAAALLALLLGFMMYRRRRQAEFASALSTIPEIAAPPAPPVPVKPRPDPVPRPWLELNLKAERASFTLTEAELLFELEIANQGGSVARNLRLDVKMINGGAEQDQEIGAFFKTAGRDSTKLNLSEVAAGVTGVINGRVTLARDEMKAMRLDERLLFIPVVAVNCLYDWGDGRIGQTSKSYVVGRELQEPSEKMGAFRVDQGPRIWRAVGQRPHKLAKRV